MRGRGIMAIGSVIRMLYGTGALLAPDWMSGRVAPDVRGHPDGRMDFRGFGGLHMSIAALTLWAAARGRSCREVLALNLGCEVSDAATTLLEWRDRGRADEMVVGSLVVAATGLTAWAAALRTL